MSQAKTVPRVRAASGRLAWESKRNGEIFWSVSLFERFINVRFPIKGQEEEEGKWLDGAAAPLFCFLFSLSARPRELPLMQFGSLVLKQPT